MYSAARVGPSMNNMMRPEAVLGRLLSADPYPYRGALQHINDMSFTEYVRLRGIGLYVSCSTVIFATEEPLQDLYDYDYD